MKYLVTGAAGFIGNFVAERLCNDGHEVIGLDNLNDYYDPALKHARLERIKHLTQFRFVKMDLADRDGIANLFKDEKFDRVIHLAAQAGVRYSIENPMAYIDSNLVGTATILEGCRHNKVQHLVYASSSSVYGMNEKMPFSTDDAVDHPVSLYAATKKSNELMAHSYSHLYDLPTTGLRFFTVYGPWGRPDMAPYLFTDAILNNREIKVFNNGKMKRDFTYIDDIVEGIIRIQDVVPKRDQSNSNTSPESSKAPYRVFNIGNNEPIALMTFIESIEKAAGKVADKNYMPMQAGDVPATFADIDSLHAEVGFKPNTNIEYGMQQFVDWYRSYNSEK
ncbi:NAD-dependent epimerase [Pseudoalteromonas distincta]|mgnify:CR=1 FL=1|jgi:UDP-glucuronate 4-epimerase|uniref:NAD-dependent epimerase n=1 Tax=Pseudoalteromonas distincta TaxID=77608 RepID=UPI0011976D94|nr:NAD-dependent epimerase [Pseudoalteromonas elyakovii]TVU77508.1 NAD-dependent epimerase [Pseudoalteromonas elyakovii]|tara:strand:+ start:5487 stop:6491 length:1005 start_codon:yes stop_codon:yes gene_type:complete